MDRNSAQGVCCFTCRDLRKYPTDPDDYDLIDELGKGATATVRQNLKLPARYRIAGTFMVFAVICTSARYSVHSFWWAFGNVFLAFDDSVSGN